MLFAILTLYLSTPSQKRPDRTFTDSQHTYTQHTYAIWDEDTRKGLEKLGIDIPATEIADPFIYGAYVSAIELLKDVAPFTCFLEHDVPRQRLFQAALAAYGRE